MDNQEKLKQAVMLLHEVSEDWKEDKVNYYPSSLPSFDELVADLATVRLDKKGLTTMKVVDLELSTECLACGTKGVRKSRTPYRVYVDSIKNVDEYQMYICPICGQKKEVIEGSEYSETYVGECAEDSDTKCPYADKVLSPLEHLQTAQYNMERVLIEGRLNTHEIEDIKDVIEKIAHLSDTL